MTKSQIIDIFQSYLNQTDREKDAREELCNFLEASDLDEVVLNSGTTQRLMMVAANFRKEVTSTALWLLGHGVNVQCIKVTPYSLEDQLFLNVEQIIPTPEEKELMIGMSAKEADEKSTVAEKKHRQHIRLQFWEQALESMKQSPCELFNNINVPKYNDNWLSAGSGFSGVHYTLIFNKDEARVEINAERSVASENKFVFDKLHAQKDEIEAAFGNPLRWERLDTGKASRIKYGQPFDSYNPDNWPEIIDWLIEHMIKLENTFKGPLAEVSGELRTKLQNNDSTISEAAE